MIARYDRDANRLRCPVDGSPLAIVSVWAGEWIDDDGRQRAYESAKLKVTVQALPGWAIGADERLAMTNYATARLHRDQRDASRLTGPAGEDARRRLATGMGRNRRPIVRALVGGRGQQKTTLKLPQPVVCPRCHDDVVLDAAALDVDLT